MARKLEKNTETVDRLEPIGRSGEQGPRANALWDLGLIGGRGVEQARVASIILASAHDENVNVRDASLGRIAAVGIKRPEIPPVGSRAPHVWREMRWTSTRLHKPARHSLRA